VYGIPRFSDGFTPLPHPGLRDGFQETVSECRQFLGSQVFVTESCCWLTGPFKIAKNGRNSSFLHMARPSHDGRLLPLEDQTRSRPVPALRLSLPGSPLVNSVAGSRIQVGRPDDSASRRAPEDRTSRRLTIMNGIVARIQRANRAREIPEVECAVDCVLRPATTAETPWPF